MSTSPYDRIASDDGEASDSGNEKPLSVQPEREDRKKEKKKKHKHKHDKERKESDGDEEERLRRRLIEKKEKESKKREDSGDEEGELFTIQPGADQRRRDREKKEKERREERDRERDRRGDVNSFHDHRDDRRRGEMERREGRDDRRRDHRLPPPHRGHPRGPNMERDRSHRRSRSRSGDRKKREEKKGGRDRSREGKRERKESEKRRDEKEKSKAASSDDQKAEVKEESAEEEEKMEVDGEKVEAQERLEEGEMKSEEVLEREASLTPTPAEIEMESKSKKYSKFDSSPESNEITDTPYQSDVEYDSDAAASPLAEDVVEEEVVDLSAIPFEKLTDEQKAMLSPDSRRVSEKEWQDRLVSNLPVYYPGINGCRSIAEYECINRIEEGTFGVVYRGKDRRTDQVVALKRLKMDKEKDGFPITSLREVNMLLKASGHENIVNVLEIVVGSNTDKTFLVMEFVEHDMKGLMDIMSKSNKTFKIGEVKTLMLQLLRGMDHLHNLWILHRDLKSSNLLINHRAVLKIADFGLAREYGDPLKAYTSIVVTLWYRSPELLLGIEKYSTEVDMWSVGCLMAEFLTLKPLFMGRSEIEQIKKIFMELGTPTEKTWPGYENMRGLKEFTPPQFPFNQMRKRFPANRLTEAGFLLLNSMLLYETGKRWTAEKALESEWFNEDPLPIAREMFPTFPAKSEPGKKPPPSQAPKQPEGPQVSAAHSQLLSGLNLSLDQAASAAKGFTLKF